MWGVSECPKVKWAGDPACECWPGRVRGDCGDVVIGHVVDRCHGQARAVGRLAGNASL